MPPEVLPGDSTERTAFQAMRSRPKDSFFSIPDESSRRVDLTEKVADGLAMVVK